MSQPWLEVAQLSYRYAGETSDALSKVSFSLGPETQSVVLMGQSGCGKTTLLKIICGLMDATDGSVQFEGQPVRGPSWKLVPGHEKIRMVFQDFQLPPHFSVQETMLFEMRHLSGPYKKQRLGELAELCNLGPFLHKKPGELSGGQTQRVALALALCAEPALLLFDEPFSHLDLVFKDELRREIRAMLRKTHTRAIWVAHDTDDAFYLADSVGVMSQGHLIQLADRQTVYNHPATPYVAQYLGFANVVPFHHLSPYLPGQEAAQLLGSRPADSLVCLRAEQVRATDDAHSHFNGVVTEVTFLGAYLHATVQIDDRLTLVAHLSVDYPVYPNSVLPLRLNTRNLHFFA